MGLLMRYVVEKSYALEIEFSDQVTHRINGKEDEFDFTDLEVRRREESLEFSSGVIRSTMDGIMLRYVEAGYFTDAEWKPFYTVLTNVGLFFFDPKDHKGPFKMAPLSDLKI